MSNILSVREVSKLYKSGSRELTVLNEVSFDVTDGESLSIVGPSGSGKTTLLGLCAGLDNPSHGTINLCGEMVNDMTEDERASLRNRKVGFVFQNFQLIPTLTALENVMIPLELLGFNDARKRSRELLDRVGLGDRTSHYPSQLSGGEQQRVSIARAFSNQPQILFADEPTGNLDDSTGEHIEELIFEINREKNTTLILVTHDLDLANKTNRIIRLKGGSIISDEKVEQSPLAQNV
ncbi:MAG: ABC transporter ATP-binding protein [Saprospiraceae bacterium]|nr:ABC transporter ATP-binding protein [Saprospiraceae bacterium]